MPRHVLEETGKATAMERRFAQKSIKSHTGPLREHGTIHTYRRYTQPHIPGEGRSWQRCPGVGESLAFVGMACQDTEGLLYHVTVHEGGWRRAC